MNHFDKSNLAPFLKKWDSIKDEIESEYSEKSKQAVVLMKTAIENYTELLEYGGKELNERTGKEKYILLPLNGEERFEFIKARIKSHYAFVQLEALYSESRKKAARLSVSRH